jgi:hypothetical protein
MKDRFLNLLIRNCGFGGLSFMGGNLALSQNDLFLLSLGLAPLPGSRVACLSDSDTGERIVIQIVSLLTGFQNPAITGVAAGLVMPGVGQS